MMKHLCVVVFLCCLLSAGCVADKRYRYFPDQSCGSEDCINLPARESGPGWELAYAEFKDDGSAWDPLQTTRVLELIEKAKADNNGATVVLLYVHGWKNNANAAPPPKRKDVEKFHVALDRVATMVSRLKEGERLPPLVGIYIGWRGATATIEPLKTLTMWPRRGVARRVGRGDLFESVNQIVDKVKSPGDTRSRLILVGHSFGARVLENAVDGLDAQNEVDGPMLAWQKALAVAPSRPPDPPADLVVFVNAATQSSLAEKAIRRLHESGAVFYGPGGSVESCKDDPAGDRRPQCRPLPLYVALSSTGDAATKYLLPVANTIIPAAPLPLRLRSAAFTGRLQSHVVTKVDCPLQVPPKAFRCEPSNALELAGQSAHRLRASAAHVPVM